jgi:hypothetical protein
VCRERDYNLIISHRPGTICDLGQNMKQEARLHHKLSWFYRTVDFLRKVSINENISTLQGRTTRESYPRRCWLDFFRRAGNYDHPTIYFFGTPAPGRVRTHDDHDVLYWLPQFPHVFDWSAPCHPRQSPAMMATLTRGTHVPWKGYIRSNSPILSFVSRADRGRRSGFCRELLPMRFQQQGYCVLTAP